MIEKSYTEEEIAEVVRKHGLPRYPKLALYREKLSRKAKAEPNFRFYCLYGQLLRMDVLRCAYEQVRANKGAPGVDRITFGDIERDKDGVDGFLTSIQQELKAKTYRASPVKRVYIEKANGKLRPLGIPTIKDRTIQAAVKLVIEPIFEADFHDCSFGFRPNRNAQQAVERIAKSVKRGKTEVYDADLTRYYDTLGRNTGYAINDTRQTVIGYDTFGRISTMQVPAAEERMNLHSTTTTPNYNSFHWNYLPGSDLKASLQYPNGLTASWQYDANNQLLQVCNATPTNVISQFDYTYDAAGRRIAMTKSGSAMSQEDTIDYAYNIRSELTNALARADADYNYAYAYDDIGNRISSSERGTNTVYAANELNQYMAVDDFTPEFDDDGNQTLVKTATGIWRIAYNGENRPVVWCRTLDGFRLAMTYDHMGRRRDKNKRQFFYYWYFQVSDNRDNAYIWNPTEPIATRTLTWFENGHSHYFVHDGNKNVVEVVREDHNVAAHYEYSDFGVVIARSGPCESANSFRFSNELSDDESMTLYYNFRYLEPKSGRWMRRDPAEEHMGVCLYGYVGNTIHARFDLLGLRNCCVCGSCQIDKVEMDDARLTGYKIVSGAGWEKMVYDENALTHATQDEILEKILGEVKKKSDDIVSGFNFVVNQTTTMGALFQPRVRHSRKVSYRIRRCRHKYRWFGDCRWERQVREVVDFDGEWTGPDSNDFDMENADWIALFYTPDKISAVNKMKALVESAAKSSLNEVSRDKMFARLKNLTGCEILEEESE